MMECERLRFNLGERRLVTLTVWLSTGEEFRLSDPRWEMVVNTRSESVGTCELAENDKSYDLTAIVEPMQRGRYSLVFSFDIGPEVRKKVVPIEVI